MSSITTWIRVIRDLLCQDLPTDKTPTMRQFENSTCMKLSKLLSEEKFAFIFKILPESLKTLYIGWLGKYKKYHILLSLFKHGAIKNEKELIIIYKYIALDGNMKALVDFSKVTDISIRGDLLMELCVAYRSIDLVKALLQIGRPINDSQLLRIYKKIVCDNDLHLFHYFLKKTDISLNNDYLLKLCVEEHRMEMVEVLLKNGRPPHMLLSKAKKFPMIKLLIENKAKAREEESVALKFVLKRQLIARDRMPCIRYLLMKDADIADVDDVTDMENYCGLQKKCRYPLVIFGLMDKKDFPVALRIAIIDFLGGEKWEFDNKDVSKFRFKRKLQESNRLRKKIRTDFSKTVVYPSLYWR